MYNKYYKSLLNRIKFLESLVYEGKQDQEILNNFLGDEYYNKYNSIKNKITDNEYKDIYKLIQKDPDEVKDYIDNIKSNTDKRRKNKSGAKKLYEDSDWIVYRITTYEAAVLYGKNTKWCITGRYNGHEEHGEEYFYDYIDDYNLDGGYYFYISKKDPSEKYCILQDKDKSIVSIWNASDENIGDSYLQAFALGEVNLPEVKEIPDSYKFNSSGGLSNKDNINAINNIKIEHFVEKGKVNKLKELLYSGLDPNYIIKNKTLLTIAFINDKFEVFNMLLEYGADPNKKNNDGQTTLMFVSIFGDNSKDNYTELLLDYGADPDIKDNRGHTALYYARLYNNKYVCEILEKYNAVEK